MSSRPDAAVLLIGNELLSGRVRDENLHYLARELWELGTPVRTVWMVRDGVNEIADAVRGLKASHAFLFTTGGIGPTHDDVTIEGVARAFSVPVVQHPQLETMIRARVGERTTAAHLRMAQVPEGASLEAPEDGVWPTIRIENAYILPGVPSILRRKFDAIKERFRQPPLFRELLHLMTTETGIAVILERAAQLFDDVEIGSYPQSGSVMITFEGDAQDRVAAARSYVDGETKGFPRIAP